MDYLRFKSSLVADLRFGKHVSLSADASYFDRVGKYTDAGNLGNGWSCGDLEVMLP